MCIGRATIPTLTKNLPRGIEKRVSSRCSDEETFKKHKGLYEEVLRASGYNCSMEYKPPTKKAEKRQRWPEQLYFNPPFSLNCRTNIGKKFLQLVDKYFPKGGKFGKSLNRHTLKISYSCMNNMAKEISSHNRKILQTTDRNQDQYGCNCRRIECPLENNCLVPTCVYQGLLSSGPLTQMFNYFGLTVNTFKERYMSHKQSFENPDYRGSTTLSSKVWELKDQGLPTEIKWRILHKTTPYQAGMKSCDLCLLEKTRILLGRKGPEEIPDDVILLNRRMEVTSKCRHKLKYTLEADYWRRQRAKDPRLNPP